MQSSKLNDRIQVAASIGVMLSLIFVGFEIKQSREIAIADIFQQKSAPAVQVQQGMISIELFVEALEKAQLGENLSPIERRRLKFGNNPWFQYWENNHFQYEIGLLSEDGWQASKNAMGKTMRRHLVQEWWESQRTYWREPFAKEVDKILAEVRAADSN